MLVELAASSECELQQRRVSLDVSEGGVRCEASRSCSGPPTGL